LLLLSHNHLVLSIYSSYTTIKNPKVYRGPWAISAQYGLHTLTHKPSLDIVYFLNIHTTSSIILIVKSDIVKDFLNKYIKLSITCFYPTIQYILFVSYCKTAVFTLNFDIRGNSVPFHYTFLSYPPGPFSLPSLQPKGCCARLPFRYKLQSLCACLAWPACHCLPSFYPLLCFLFQYQAVVSYQQGRY